MVSGRPSGFYPDCWGSIPHGRTLISHGLDNHLYGINNGPCPALPGPVAHLGERCFCKAEVESSSLSRSICHLFRRVVRHRHKSPSDILAELLNESRKLVANTETLTAAVAANQAAVAANTTAVTAAVDAITNDPTQAAVDAAVTQVQADTTQVEANTTALDNAVTPPAPVPPVEG
jgi:hypothetical protein